EEATRRPRASQGRIEGRAAGANAGVREQIERPRGEVGESAAARRALTRRDERVEPAPAGPEEGLVGEPAPDVGTEHDAAAGPGGGRIEVGVDAGERGRFAENRERVDRSHVARHEHALALSEEGGILGGPPDARGAETVAGPQRRDVAQAG